MAIVTCTRLRLSSWTHGLFALAMVERAAVEFGKADAGGSTYAQSSPSSVVRRGCKV